jgi:hypothetical protein
MQFFLMTASQTSDRFTDGLDRVLKGPSSGLCTLGFLPVKRDRDPRRLVVLAGDRSLRQADGRRGSSRRCLQADRRPPARKHMFFFVESLSIVAAVLTSSTCQHQAPVMDSSSLAPQAALRGADAILFRKCVHSACRLSRNTLPGKYGRGRQHRPARPVWAPS